MKTPQLLGGLAASLVIVAGVVLFVLQGDADRRPAPSPNSVESVPDTVLVELAPSESGAARTELDPIGLAEAEPEQPRALDPALERQLAALREADLEPRIEQLQALLEEYTADKFAAAFDRGDYVEVTSISSSDLRDEQGRARPSSTRTVGGRTQAVYLSEEEAPEAWAIMQEFDAAMRSKSKLARFRAGARDPFERGLAK